MAAPGHMRPGLSTKTQVRGTVRVLRGPEALLGKWEAPEAGGGGKASGGMHSTPSAEQRPSWLPDAGLQAASWLHG